MTAPHTTLGELADRCAGTLIGDRDVRVAQIAMPADAREDAVTFAPHPRHWREVFHTRAAAVICSTDHAASYADELPCAVLCADNVGLLYQKVAALLYPRAQDPHLLTAPEIHPTAIVHDDVIIEEDVHIGAYAVVKKARIGERVHIGEHVVIGDGVVIEEDVVIAPRVVIERGTHIGARTRIQAGVVIGSDGFGYAPDGDANIKVAQLGRVVIGPDVEIGANSAIDRGQIRDTRIGRGTKIDNLVQVGHGVQVGDHAVIIAQTGLSGDVDVGEGALLAGQVGVVPFTKIGARARVGAKSGVAHDVGAGAAVSGIPAYPHADWLRTSVLNRRIGALFKRVAALEAQARVP